MIMTAASYRPCPQDSRAPAAYGGVPSDCKFLEYELHCTTVVTPKSPRIESEYCTQCRWLLREAWMAQELLTTFQSEIGEVALIPGTGGVLEIRLDSEVIWSRVGEGHFPEIKEVKQRVRDRVAPGRDLGHSDR
jgi:selenoprotein W-related protein